MIDFHSHILPKMDDGSKSPEESIQMLTSYSSRVDGVVLSPHFYPTDEMLDAFLARRKKCGLLLMEALQKQKKENPDFKIPKMYLGAEVAYFDAIDTCEGIENLLIHGTNLLLVEMPMKEWNQRMMDKLISLYENKNVRPVLAHLDRYLFSHHVGPDTKLLENYLRNGGLVQINADSLLNPSRRRKLLLLFENGLAHFIGSDTHNLTTRHQNVDEVLDMLQKTHNDTVIRDIEEVERCVVLNQ